jgi:small-conductance mechanosensitive channel
MIEVGDCHLRRLIASVARPTAVLLLCGCLALATTRTHASDTTGKPGGAPASAPVAAASPSPANAAAIDKQLPTAAQIIGFLDRTVDWFRARTAEQQLATEPSDVAALADSRPTAEQIVRAAFEFARSAAALVPANSQRNAPVTSGRYAQLLARQQQLDQQAQSLQQQVSAVRERLAHASVTRRQALQTQLNGLQAQLALMQARRDAVGQFLQFLDNSLNAAGGEGLKGQIATLESSLSLQGDGAAKSATSTASASGAAAAVSSDGIWDLAARVFSLSGKIGRIDQYRQQTTGLSQAEQGMRDRLLAVMRDDSNRADQLLDDHGASPAGTDPASQRQQLQMLTTQFKAVTTTLVPLAKLNVLFDQYQADLGAWRDGVRRELVQTWRTLGLRLAVLALILALVLGASELWRRAVNRYVHDARRRYQFMLLRRFAMWFVIAIVLASMFASRLSSFVTFAGLITAGIAVAMQNVILSVVAYFFLIGKYGIRAGDRVQIGDVLGEVIDVGLVRMHLMEYARGTLAPTGRVVAFSNSIVFQASGGLFKQIPGVYFGWHEITLMLSPGSQPTEVRGRLLAGVERALAGHKDEIERQNREIERTSIVPTDRSLRPSVRLRFVSSGVEVTVRYPVDQRYGAEIDEAVSREILRALDQEPKLQAVGGPELKLNPLPST